MSTESWIASTPTNRAHSNTHAADRSRLGAYRLLKPLGRGGMGTVYLAIHVARAETVALKTLSPRFRDDPRVARRFAREARVLASVSHPNVVRWIDSGLDPEPYLVMEHVDGLDLARLFTALRVRGERLSLGACLFVAAEIASALAHAHALTDCTGTPLGLVHRDISPQNLLVSRRGEVKLIDFGLSRIAEGAWQTTAGAALGKVRYAAPEQLLTGFEVDERADVYSLGVVLWEMLAGRALYDLRCPLTIAERAMEMAPIPPPCEPGARPEVDELVLGALEKNPARRIASAAMFASRIREVLGEVAPSFDGSELAVLVDRLGDAVST